MKRTQVLETINSFPPEFDLDELIERLIFIEKVEKGLAQIKEGRTKTHEEVKELTKKWSK